MAPQITSDVITWALTAILGAIAGWALAWARSSVERRNERDRSEAEQMDALRSGMRSLLRCELVRAHRDHVLRREPMTLDDREYVERTYDSYHRLGGNGMGTRLYEELMDVRLQARDDWRNDGKGGDVRA